MSARKSDLQHTVDEQQLKIEKYEKKLRDVIRAYKSLAAEKSALEESMKALTVHEEEDVQNEANEINKEFNGEKEDVKLEESDAASITSSVDTSISENINSDIIAKPSIDTSGNKIAVLHRALATITEEKSRQDKAFTADRKNLLQEIDALKEEVKKRETEAATTESLLKQQIQELKANLCQVQCERECDQTDHAAMLKELQEKLNLGRLQCESFQKQIIALTNDLKKKEQEPDEGRQLVEQLLDENHRMKDKLDAAEKKLAEMPQVSRMQMELFEIKAQHQAALEQEQTRSSHLSKELSRMKDQCEDRPVILEAKIADLTSALSEYERLHRQYLDTIEKLTSRINELDQENTTLAKLTVCRHCNDRSTDESVQSMLDKLKKLTADIRHRCDDKDYAGIPIDLYDTLALDSPNSEHIHVKCRADYDALKDEFEKYKLRAQTALKSKNFVKDSDTAEKRELEQLRRIVSDLQQSLAESQRQCATSECACQELRRSMAQSKEDHKRELVELENQMKQRMAELEAETSKQRGRALEILAEKEKELETTRVIMRAIRSSSPYAGMSADHPGKKISSTRRPPSASHEMHSVERRGSSESVNSAMYETTSMDGCDSNTTTNHASNIPNMHLSHELARKEKSMDQMKRDIRQLENTIRETERSSLTKELQHYDTIEKLKDEIRSLESKLSRHQMTGDNLEYLKNVLVQYMSCDDAHGRAHMLKAIGRALHLSSKELDAIQKHNARYYTWWPAAGKASK